MIPSISTTPISGNFQYGDSLQTSDLTDYEMGGVSLYDGSQGLLVKLWKIQYISPDVIISENGANATTIFSASGITELSFTFDANMNPFITYVQNGDAKYRWYDPTIPGFTTSTLPAGSRNPRTCFDDKRLIQIVTAQSEIILAYINSNNLYIRAQTERFETEHLFKSGVTGKLIKIGMNDKNRLQFMIKK